MRLSAFARSGLVLFVAPALASAAGSSPEAWGTTANTVVAIHAGTFQLVPIGPPTSDLVVGDAGIRSCASGECNWTHSLQLPTGALITGAELSACDGDTTEGLDFYVISQQKPAVDSVDVVAGSTGDGPTPGCQNFPVSLAVPAVVDNNTYSYILVVGAPPGTNLGFISARVMYRLQVRAAPAVATFPVDVPTTHPFFRFIEALAASGITAGCGVQMYCPDNPITRGEMAVFLAAALGLHFPN